MRLAWHIGVEQVVIEIEHAEPPADIEAAEAAAVAAELWATGVERLVRKLTIVVFGVYSCCPRP